MYCKYCGKQIVDDARFCPNCGENLASEENVDKNSAEMTSDNVEMKEAPFVVCIILSVIAGVIGGFLPFLLFGEIGGLILSSIEAGIIFGFVAFRLFPNSHIRGLLAILSFVIFGIIYILTFWRIEEIALFDSNIQDCIMFLYMCSPIFVLTLILTELKRRNTSLKRFDRIVFGWIVVLVLAFFAFMYDENRISNQKENVKPQVEYSGKTDNATETPKDNEIKNDLNDDNGSGNIVDGNIDYQQLEQELFDSVNYSLSIGITSNCDMSQETLKAIYETIEDGSFIENTMFGYVSEYGKDRYNYEIEYDGLTLIIYYDGVTNLYGFEITQY